MPKRTDKNNAFLKTPPPLRGRSGGGACAGRMYLQRAQELQTTDRSRALRKNMTDVEKKLWRALRGAQLERFKFRRQFPIDIYIADFVCIENRLVIELDGGQHATAEHYDTKRTNYIESQGFRIIRFWNNDILQNFEGVLTMILGHLRRPPTQPSPARGEGFIEPANA